MKKMEYGELGKKEKQRALVEFIQRSLVIALHQTALRNKDVKKVAEAHLLYSNYTKHELFDKDGAYLGLFNIHEESVSLDI